MLDYQHSHIQDGQQQNLDQDAQGLGHHPAVPYSFLPHAGPHNMPHFMSHPAFVQPYAAYDTNDLRPPMAMGFDPTFQQSAYQQSAIQPQHGQTQPAQDAKFGMNPPVQRTNSGSSSTDHKQQQYGQYAQPEVTSPQTAANQTSQSQRNTYSAQTPYGQQNFFYPYGIPGYPYPQMPQNSQYQYGHKYFGAPNPLIYNPNPASTSTTGYAEDSDYSKHGQASMFPVHSGYYYPPQDPIVGQPQPPQHGKTAQTGSTASSSKTSASFSPPPTNAQSGNSMYSNNRDTTSFYATPQYVGQANPTTGHPAYPHQSTGYSTGSGQRNQNFQ